MLHKIHSSCSTTHPMIKIPYISFRNFLFAFPRSLTCPQEEKCTCNFRFAVTRRTGCHKWETPFIWMDILKVTSVLAYGPREYATSRVQHIHTYIHLYTFARDSTMVLTRCSKSFASPNNFRILRIFILSCRGNFVNLRYSSSFSRFLHTWIRFHPLSNRQRDSN